MERVALYESLFGMFRLLTSLLVKVRNTLQGGDNVLPESILILDRFRYEESSPQNLSDILLYDGLNAFFALPTKDRVELLCNLFTKFVTLARIGSQQ